MIPPAINLNFPNIKFWNIYKPFFKEDYHKRYKILYGGRGGSKSWQIARALLMRGYRKKLRILCTREIQRSIKQSVHKLLEKQIEKLGLGFWYTVKDKSIIGLNGTEFIFEGLYRNIDSIKSMEGINIAWVEEGHAVSENSWTILIPTIREEDSEIWVSFNMDDEDDPVVKRFISHKRDDVYIYKINYWDNPHFGEPLKTEMEYDKKYNYPLYLHVWEGEPISNYDSCIYYNFNKKVNCVDEELTYNQGIETCCSWDFGVSDDTFIIFYQILKVPKCEEFPRGYRINIFDEYVNNNQLAEHYRDVVEAKQYHVTTHYCDPSGIARDSSLESWVDKLAYNNKRKTRDWSFIYNHSFTVADMIDDSNEWLPFVRINPHQTPNVYNMFRKWMYRTDKDGVVVNPPKPMHDKYSHPGTSFYYFIINRFPSSKTSGAQIL